MNELQIIHVTWVDAEAISSWSEINEVLEPIEETHSIGIKVDENNEFICLALTYDPSTETLNAIMKIPQVCVTKTRTLCRIKMKK